jgi:hypothetical protein
VNENTISIPYRFLKDRSAMVSGLVLTITLELITLALRFGARLESTRDTASTIGRLTFGLRIHHGYVGLAIILVAYALSDQYPKASRLAFFQRYDSPFFGSVADHR